MEAVTLSSFQASSMGKHFPNVNEDDVIYQNILNSDIFLLYNRNAIFFYFFSFKNKLKKKDNTMAKSISLQIKAILIKNF